MCGAFDVACTGSVMHPNRCQSKSPIAPQKWHPTFRRFPHLGGHAQQHHKRDARSRASRARTST
ncbi:hypothetical protein GGTG_04767 [Gaeumannomyces tritici R3-111a-1]|uniref:Uncharacterized protein n=1 Tax=Gaeumannomyces tritici (strain R3-111a-1) TaxID=644352 RepID=J3NU16_GAET3|nr:hypothetical protein GGTG_04767 [Gaeumannomyces tritici R3-111a-1]EJT79683.1 hypothetical protein GGTG_04767 [Gaeumannomyces tritici R3-111a-1]